METHPPPWHFLKYYRYMEKYGAVCIGSQYSHMMGGPFEFKEDGTWGPRTMLKAEERPIKTREDAIREAVATKLNSVLNDKIKPTKNMTVLIGGVAGNSGLINELKRRSGINFLIPEQAVFAGALGAALIAAD